MTIVLVVEERDHVREQDIVGPLSTEEYGEARSSILTIRGKHLNVFRLYLNHSLRVINPYIYLVENPTQKGNPIFSS